jgi:HSP20 family protein
MATVNRRKTMSEQKMTPAKTGQSPTRRWDPFSRLSQLESEFERLFDMRWPRMRPFQQLWAGGNEFVPRVDIYEQNGDLITKAELPGVKKEDVDVSLEGGDLVIRGERKQESEVKEENFYRMERLSGSFYRRLPMPEGVQADQIKANFSDGVLEIRVPKPQPAEEKATKIEIK